MERLHVWGALALEVGNEIGEQTRLLVTLHTHVDAVVGDELAEGF